MRGFVIGALIGAGVALLLAPQSGAALRERVRDKATKLANDTEEFVEGKAKHVRNKVQGYRAKARRAAETVVDRMSERMANMGEPAA